jgi:hypothetical protein
MTKPFDNKTPDMIAAIEGMFPGTKHAIDHSKCPLCRSDIDKTKFADALSLKEYYISGMCQNCQDEMFRSGHEDNE